MPKTAEQEIITPDVDWQEEPPIQKSDLEETIESPFTCECFPEYRSVCKGLSADYEYEGKRYCVLHYPSNEKSKAADFNETFQRKLKDQDCNFCGVWFPENLNLSGRTFSTKVAFNEAIFSEKVKFINTTFEKGAEFKGTKFDAGAEFSGIFNGFVSFLQSSFGVVADFENSEFNAGVDFRNAIFKKDTKTTFNFVTFRGIANFRGTIFDDETRFHVTFKNNVDNAGYVDFSDAKFRAKVDFSHTNFKEITYLTFRSAVFDATADFRESKFKEVSFKETNFKDYVLFSGKDAFGEGSSLDLQYARFEKSERVSFHHLTLRPYWFVNVDARKFEFTDVKWQDTTISEEIEALNSRAILSPHKLLSIACRNLAIRAEENHRYEKASDFRFMAMDAQRLEIWRGWAFWKLRWWYWAASGYGERIRNALIWLIVILCGFATLYLFVCFEKPMENYWSSLLYSLNVAALQKPEPKALTSWARFLVGAETILVPLQAALLALAIRRKFMR